MEEALIAGVLALLAGGPAGKEEALLDKLRGRLQEIDRRLDGALALSVKDLTSGRMIELGATETFATASCIKPAVLLELYHAAARGEVDLQASAPLPATRVGGGGVLELLGARVVLSWRDLAVLMMSWSDNDATNALIDRLGMDAVNRRLDALGLGGTRLRRRMMDTEAARRGEENVSTAAELRALLEAVRSGGALPPALAADLRQVASAPKRSEFEVPHPEGLRVFSKTGYLDGVRCWAAVVELPHRPYAAAVMLGHLRSDAEGEAAVREVASVLLSTFERLAHGSEHGRRGMRP